MRILHVLDHSIPLQSGYSFRTRAILQQQRAFGWETFHVTSAKHSAAVQEKEQVDGLQFFRTRPLGGLVAKTPVLNQLAVISTLRTRIRQVVDEVRPDIIHAHSPALNGIAALGVAKDRGIPLVYEVRAFWEDAAVDHGTSREWGPRYRMTRAVETHVLRRAAAITTICEGLRDDIIGRGIPPERVTVVPNAVDTAVFRRPSAVQADPDLRRQMGLAGKLVLGFIGSFYAYEGLPLLIRALPEILSRHPDARVLLAGGGPQAEQIGDLVGAMGLREVVTAVGRVPHGEVQRYYELVDIFIYPRLSMRLTELVTPLKPLEAMALGKLVLASDVGGHRELIRDGDNGFLFEAGSAGALAAAVTGLLGRKEWDTVRQRAREYVEGERNWSNSADRYRAVYESAIADNE